MELWYDFLEIIDDLLEDESVQSLKHIKHHVCLSCYEHSIFVAYMSYCAAYKLGLDYVSAARAGLLHDLYLEEGRALPAMKHYFTHAKLALENAQKVCPLSKKEENIIRSHMWPMTTVLPGSREAYLVSMCDKYCAVVEGLHIWHRMKIRKRIPVAGV